MVDTELIERMKNKDKTAFKSLFFLYKEKVYNTAFMIVKNKSIAEDIVQEAFLQIYLKIHTLNSAQNFDIWVYRITVNYCFAALRINKRLLTVSIDECIENGLSFSNNFEELPEIVALTKEKKLEIMNCINDLNPVQRICILLFYYEDLTIKEIAEVLDCSENTVKSRLFQGKKALKKVLISYSINYHNEKKLGGAHCES